METILDKIQFIKLLQSLYYASFPKGVGLVTFSLECSKNSNSLFKYDQTKVEITAEDDQAKSDVVECLDRAGATYLTVQFSPSSKTKVDEIGSDYVKTKTGVIIPKERKIQSKDWARWFFEVMAMGGDATYLIPDTNFLRRHYFSNVLRPLLGEDNFKKLNIKLPRLVLLEIEGRYNRYRRAPGKPEKNETDGKERRLAFSTAKEVLFLKMNGATLLDEIDPSILEGFSRIAGGQNTDAWIRREIHDYERTLDDIDRVTAGSSPRPGSLFLTCDLMNAFAASAEDIATLFFSRNSAEEYFMEQGIAQVAELIIAVAISFGSVKLVVNYLDKKQEHLVDGIWSGKTIPDWENDCLLIH